MANTSPDDVAQLKLELAQFLLTEITSAQGATTFRQEVSDQVGSVIDKILAERFAPVLERMEQDSARQVRQVTDRVEQALRQLEEVTPGGAATEQQLADIAMRLDEFRHRLARVEDQGRDDKRASAIAPPLPVPAATERDRALSPETAPAPAASWPRWALWLLILLGVLTTAGLANLYYERLTTPSVSPAAPSLPAASPPASRASGTPSSAVGAAAPPPDTVSVPPQTIVATPAATPPPVMPSLKPQAPSQPGPAPHGRIPADFAIERGWIAAQPFAVEPRLARRVGSSEAIPTLRSVVCASEICTSDALLSAAPAAKQVIALQMLMSQIGDRFCAPRRTVAVTGQVSAGGLADLAAIAKCAGGSAHPCVETLDKVCPPDADALQAGMPSARAALLRWALWKTGST